MTTPVVESITPSIFSTADNNHLVAMPATVDVSDLLVTGFSNFWGAGDTIDTPSGWNLLHSTSNTNIFSSLFYKIADGTEDGTTVDFVTSGSNPNRKAVAHVYRISAWHGTTPPEIGTAATGASVNPDPPSLTPSWGAVDTLWLVVAGASGAVTVSAYPTNYTDGNDDATTSGTAAAIGSARRALNAATEDPGTLTISSSTNWVAQTVAIPPASGTSHTRTVESIIVSTLVDA